MKKKSLALLGGPKTRTKPFAPHPVMGPEERRQVLSVLKSGVLSGFIAKPGENFLGGPKVKELERLFCGYFGTKHAVSMNSATSALHAALLALGIEPGDEVLVTPYTMSASATAILMCGALPVFVDIEDKTFCLDPAKIESKITPKTKAVVVVHLFGHAADMDPILEIARRRALKVLEDCAQSPGARYKEKFVGTLGDIGVFSLNQHKTITTGEGGVAVTEDDALALKMQLVRNHGEVVADHLPAARDMQCLGWNYRMPELEAGVGIEQFKKLGQLTSHRVRLAEYLTKKLAKLKGLRTPVIKPYSNHVYFVYPIVVDETAFGVSRDVLVKALNAEWIPFGAGYVRPIYLEPIYQKRRIYAHSPFPFDLQGPENRDNYRKGSCPNAEFFYEIYHISQ